MGMLHRGNSDTFLPNRRKYERLLRKYDRVEKARDRMEGEGVLVTLIISVCLLLTIGSILSILQSLRGM